MRFVDGLRSHILRTSGNQKVDCDDKHKREEGVANVPDACRAMVYPDAVASS